MFFTKSKVLDVSELLREGVPCRGCLNCQGLTPLPCSAKSGDQSQTVCGRAQRSVGGIKGETLSKIYGSKTG